MDINRKTRKQLKEFFVKNAIPTESNFADLIDAGMNQMDDGVAKPDGSPLCIASSGDTRKAINFYTSFADPDPAWSLTLNPRSKADDPTSAREGFAVTDGAGMARLFIDRQGNLGVGTQTPDRRLVIARSGNDTEVSVNDHLFLDGSGGTVRVTNNALLSSGAWALKDNTKRAFTLEIRDSGMLELYGTVTIGNTDWRKMATFDAPNNKVAFPSGDVDMAGNLSLSTRGRELFFADNGQIRSLDNSHRLLFRRSENKLELREYGDIIFSSGATAGNETAKVVLNSSGLMGIGTPTPEDKLNVYDGDVRISGGRYRRLKIISDRYWAGIELVARGQGEAGHPHIDFTHGDLDVPNYGIRIYAPDNDLLEITGNLKVPRLRLGNKWLMSGVGDWAANDDWLRLTTVAGNGYYGGFAAGRLYTAQGALAGSDARMKRDIRSLGSSIEKLCRLRGVSFQWRAGDSEGGPRLGLLAQEVEPVFPELVGRGADGMKGLDYGGFIAPVIEAIKDLRDQIEHLKRSAIT